MCNDDTRHGRMLKRILDDACALREYEIGGNGFFCWAPACKILELSPCGIPSSKLIGEVEAESMSVSQCQ